MDSKNFLLCFWISTIPVSVLVLVKIVQLIETCINYLRNPANEEARETHQTTAANRVEFATLEEIRIVSDDDAQPKPAENSPHNYGGLVYDACSCTTTQESSTGEVGDNSCCAICIQEYAVGDRRATVAACNHRFHASCVEAWLAKDEKHTCPLCRKTVD